MNRWHTFSFTQRLFPNLTFLAKVNLELAYSSMSCHSGPFHLWWSCNRSCSESRKSAWTWRPILEDPHGEGGGGGIESPSHNALQLNCTTNYEFMIDHHSYTHNLSSCEIKAWKKIQAWMVFKPMTSAVTEQWSTDWAIMPSGSWSLSEFVMYL